MELIVNMILVSNILLEIIELSIIFLFFYHFGRIIIIFILHLFNLTLIHSIFETLILVLRIRIRKLFLNIIILIILVSLSISTMDTISL